ncbi:hypothetical protein [Xanthomonas campestris]|uniref:hypothetical protein n=1 Tax=Xanthomonas campestris TaxID=339 RepID=UPI002B22F119|nr:hypothetical protein [Xanthomonas campestris]MEA9559116.1 hypothetical protein [Xanthomonas campestris]MEA9723688.1 hypothetical protein [Xanthomonas campestris]MEB1883972.1 hypothetical protein [Xanthomonas campestris pv. campestris]
MPKYDLVSQEDEWGCAAACVASLLNIPYSRAKRLLEREKRAGIDDEPEGFEIDEIARALYSKGVKVIADWNPPSKLPSGTIVCVHSRVRYASYHYLLKVPGGYMDPWFDLIEDCREAKVRKDIPKGTKIVVALIPTKKVKSN